MKKLAAVVVASVLSIATFGCASSTDDADGAGNAAAQFHEGAATSVKATTEERLARLGGVHNVTGIDNDQQLELGIVEFGGDSALNGNQLFLSAFHSDHGGGGVFELGLNINTFTKATMTGPGEVTITGTYDTIDGATGDIKTGVPLEAKVKLSVTSRDVLASATVTRDGKAETVTASRDLATSFFSQLQAVKTQVSAKEKLVTVFETGGGGPAMNGDRLILSVMSFPSEKFYDLGLDVLTVDKLSFTSETQARIEGSENFQSGSSIKTRPYAYTIAFTIGADGAPSSTVKLTRVK